MSIEKTNKVDLMGLNQETGKVELAIVDDSAWGDSMTHLQLLQDKVNSYLNFIESKEIYDTYPAAENRQVKIIIIAQYEPDQAGKDFISRLSDNLSDFGYEFEFRL